MASRGEAGGMRGKCVLGNGEKELRPGQGVREKQREER